MNQKSYYKETQNTYILRTKKNKLMWEKLQQNIIELRLVEVERVDERICFIRGWLIRSQARRYKFGMHKIQYEICVKLNFELCAFQVHIYLLSSHLELNTQEPIQNLHKIYKINTQISTIVSHYQSKNPCGTKKSSEINVNDHLLCI